MSCLPKHGRVPCTRCFGSGTVEFDRSRREGDGWRISANPLAWGSSQPEIVVLGFSKGPTQAGSLHSTPHDSIAFKGGRTNVGKILMHVGLVPKQPVAQLSSYVDSLLSDSDGRFHFASLIRCTVERFDRNEASWKGSGGGMLDKFLATPFGRSIAENCAGAHLRDLPSLTRLVVMFGLGSRLNYVDSALRVISQARSGAWSKVNPVAYSDGQLTVVHVEHFAAQGALIPCWLGERDHPRAELGRYAQEAVDWALRMRG